MARVIVLDSFESDLEKVSSGRVRDAIVDAVALLQQFPQRGSANVPSSMREQYGDVRKIVVKPLDIVYRYDAASDTAIVMGLVHARAAY